MRQRLRSRLSYANVIATLALFIALGGGTTAVALNGSNTVQSDDLGPGAQVKAPDIADNAVDGADIARDAVQAPEIAQNGVGKGEIRNDAVGTSKVANGSLTGDDLADNSLTGGDVNESTLGQVPSAASADSVGGKSAGELEGARASAMVLGSQCDPQSGFCPISRNKRVAYAFHLGPGKYCVGVNGIPANDSQSLALVWPTFPQPEQWAYWRLAALGSNQDCVGSEYEIYAILRGSFTDMRFTIVIP